MNDNRKALIHYYSTRLEDPSLIGQGIWTDNGEGATVLLVPCGGSRRSGHALFVTKEARDEAVRLMEAHGGFPNIHAAWWDVELSVEWGEEIDDLLMPWIWAKEGHGGYSVTWDEVLEVDRRNGEILGYTADAIRQYIAKVTEMHNPSGS